MALGLPSPPSPARPTTHWTCWPAGHQHVPCLDASAAAVPKGAECCSPAALSLQELPAPIGSHSTDRLLFSPGPRAEQSQPCWAASQGKQWLSGISSRGTKCRARLGSSVSPETAAQSHEGWALWRPTAQANGSRARADRRRWELELPLEAATPFPRPLRGCQGSRGNPLLRGHPQPVWMALVLHSPPTKDMPSRSSRSQLSPDPCGAPKKRLQALSAAGPIHHHPANASPFSAGSSAQEAEKNPFLPIGFPPASLSSFKAAQPLARDFLALLFSLETAPRVFTKMIVVVAAVHHHHLQDYNSLIY